MSPSPSFSSARAAPAWFKLVVLGSALIVSLALSPPYAGPNLYALQAQAWLAGHLDVAGPAEDLSRVGRRWYVAFPPGPSVLLLPLAAVHRTGYRALRAVGLALAAGAAWVAYRVLVRLEMPPETRPALVLALLAGTAFWSSVVRSETVWYLAHLVATLCALLAIEEALGRGRGLLAGLWTGLAFLSRQLCVYLTLFVAVALWVRHEPAGRRRQLRAVGSVWMAVGAGVAILMALDAARFGSPFDTGYSRMPLWDFLGERVGRYGLFHPAYLPFNFEHMFLQGPHVVFGGARLLAPLRFDEMGTALTFASPFVFLACGARGDRRLRLAAWAAVLLALGHALLYYNNGSEQMNAQRFSLDFLPVLWVLVALGVRSTQYCWWRGLVVWSVAWNVLALVVLPLLARMLAGL